MFNPPDSGKSESAVLKATGKGWSEWLAILDAEEAATWPHQEIAAWVDEHFPIGGWWAQSVAVGYERLRGLRRANQQAHGFTVNASRTFDAPLGLLIDAFIDANARGQWLAPNLMSMQSLKFGRRARFNFRADHSRLDAQFAAKSDLKSVVVLSHERIASRAEYESWRAFWKDRLNRLAEWLVENQRAYNP